ncbi:MAG: carbamoyltransferase C-terminal domain-containing protein [Coxiellaceae bacterium]|nr:carbamoyltransferase C-terminal domain-containing protein [Coxiellaceae bacterium]
MYILGIGDVTHDASVCLTKDGEVIAAIEGERLTRQKHGMCPDPRQYSIEHQGAHIQSILDDHRLAARQSAQKQLINYCLEKAGITPDDINYTVSSSLHEDPTFQYDATFIHHHVAHASSAFFPSPFEKAAVLVVDGYGSMSEGESECVLYAAGAGKSLTVLDAVKGQHMLTKEELQQGIKPPHMVFSNSIGVFYQNMSLLIGMGYYCEGKTMGLSAYGKWHPALEVIRENVQLLPEGKIQINNRAIFEYIKRLLKENMHLNEEKLFQLKADLAYCCQQSAEAMIFHACNHLYDITRCKSICLAGGVALNSVANGKILQHTGFEKIFVQPAAGDNGIAIGCALYGAHVLSNKPRVYSAKKPFSPYLGKSYRAINFDKYKAQLNIIEKVNKPHEVAAKYISEGKIVGWFNNGCEIGPRALGNRSILADPRNPLMKDIVNRRVKHRESYRPFAPAVLEEKAHEYFNVLCSAYYMLLVASVNEEAKGLIPAVTHVDGTARVQMVNKVLNPDFYSIIQSFEEITGVAVVLNTSFNDANEPIVETPDDAIRCFLNTEIDVLFINKMLLTKNDEKN